MVFFNMIPSLSIPKEFNLNDKKRVKTIKHNTYKKQTKTTIKRNNKRKIKFVSRPKKMWGGANDCNTDTLISEPNINIPSIIKGLDMGLSINKTIARIEKNAKN